MNKKVGLLLLGVCAALLVAYIVAGPFITIHRIRVALRTHDSDTLASTIEFPVLRERLKEQLNAMVLDKAANDLKGNPFAGLGALLVSHLVEGYIDAAVTPAGLSRLMSGRSPSPGTEAEPSDPAHDVFREADYAYSGLSRFYASVPTRTGSHIRFEFTRYDLSWRLTDIQIPAEGFTGDPGTPRANGESDAPAADQSTGPASATVSALACLKLQNVDSSVLSTNQVFTEVAWKADVVNSCASDFQASVKFSLYDKDDFELDSDTKEVAIPALQTAKARGKMLVSPPDKAARVAKGSASLSLN